MQNVQKIALTNTARTKTTYVIELAPALRQLKTLDSNLVTAVSATSALLFQLALDAGHETIAIALATVFTIGFAITIMKTFKQ